MYFLGHLDETLDFCKVLIIPLTTSRTDLILPSLLLQGRHQIQQISESLSRAPIVQIEGSQSAFHWHNKFMGNNVEIAIARHCHSGWWIQYLQPCHLLFHSSLDLEKRWKAAVTGLIIHREASLLLTIQSLYGCYGDIWIRCFTGPALYFPNGGTFLESSVLPSDFRIRP